MTLTLVLNFDERCRGEFQIPAKFAAEQIELADGVLSVSYDGTKTEVINGENKVVYQGIAQRAFKQQFTLSEDVVVQGAELINCLLSINLEKIIPDEKKPRMIEIKSPKRISSK